MKQPGWSPPAEIDAGSPANANAGRLAEGPSPEEREAYARRLRQRRVAEAFDEGEARLAEASGWGSATAARHSSPPRAR